MPATNEALSASETATLEELSKTGAVLDYGAGSTTTDPAYEDLFPAPARRIEEICKILGVRVDAWPDEIEHLSINGTEHEETELRGLDKLKAKGVGLGEFVVTVAIESLDIEEGGDDGYGGDVHVAVMLRSAMYPVRIVAEGSWWDSERDEGPLVEFQIDYDISQMES